jgi:hypothetical protein
MHKDPKFKKTLKEMLECYQQNGLLMDPLPKLRFVSDDEQANDIYGRTGYYDPKSMQIVIYIKGRHPKDVLRSLSHELVHHDQNLRGLFNTDKAISEDPAYAQSNPYLRKMEMDANLRGNMMFRDFTDKQKYSKA